MISLFQKVVNLEPSKIEPNITKSEKDLPVKDVEQKSRFSMKTRKLIIQYLAYVYENGRYFQNLS